MPAGLPQFLVGGGGGLDEDFRTRGVVRFVEGAEIGLVNVEVGERDVEGGRIAFSNGVRLDEKSQKGNQIGEDGLILAIWGR